jgi:hypothetical protein
MSLSIASARKSAPALPPTLQPFSTWKGTFTGFEPVAHEALFYIGFGQFNYDSQFSQPFSTSSAKSGTSP